MFGKTAKILFIINSYSSVNVGYLAMIFDASIFNYFIKLYYYLYYSMDTEVHACSSVSTVK